MGLLSILKKVIAYPSVFLDELSDALADAGERLMSYPSVFFDRLLNAFADAGKRLGSVLLGHKPPSGKIRAALRQQYLELLPGEKEIPGVEWEGRVYYETPK